MPILEKSKYTNLSILQTWPLQFL